MPVSVAPPIAKRVTQWDEYSGRFEAVASVEVRARVSGFIDKLHFRDGQTRAAPTTSSSRSNYGESYERNVGMESPLKLARGLNGLWTKGGLMYAIPLR